MEKKIKINYSIDKDNCAPGTLKNNKKSKFKTCYSKESLIKIAELWNKENKSNINKNIHEFFDLNKVKRIQNE